jgi:hypothetical protein
VVIRSRRHARRSAEERLQTQREQREVVEAVDLVPVR